MEKRNEMTFAEKILAYRATNNISAKEFAKMSKLSLQTVYSIENGIQTPSKITRLKIEHVLHKGEKKNGGNQDK